MKKALFIISFLGGFILLSTSAYAQTPVSGFIKEDTVWGPDKSPYVIVDYISVAEGATLTIESGVEVKFLARRLQSHHTHLDSSGKGTAITDCITCHRHDPEIKTGACNTCHSKGGAFNGVDDPNVGALANWEDGIYTADGKLLPGKEDWCLGCHDDDPSFIEGIYAPNIGGDNDTYGFKVTGHDINCLSCHDASKGHIDGNPRTYEVDEVNALVVNPYCDSYRLKDIGGQPSMNIPRPIYEIGTNPLTYWQDFALCFGCHNRYEVVGWSRFASSNTNFKTGLNAHYRHIGEFYSKHFDSDWDGVADSTETCIACHNVHGSPTKVMIRHGELISTYGTTDKVPALNFAYLIQPTDATATWPFQGVSDTYYVYARWTADPSRASNAKYIINYSTGSDTIYDVNQKINGGTWNKLKTSPYSFVAGNSVVLSGDDANGWIIADAIGWDRDDTFVDDWDMDGVLDPEIVVDNDNATYTPSDWLSSSWASGYHGTDYQYYVIPTRDPDATLVESKGGNMAWNGKTIVQNGVCNSCHSQSGVPYLRAPFLGPKVLTPNADPESVLADGLTTVTLTCTVFDHNSNVTGVTINLSPIGGVTENMVDQGGGLYSYQTEVPDITDPGEKSLLITATDPEGTAKNNIIMEVTNPGVVIVDNVNGTPQGAWDTSTWSPGYYGSNYHYHLTGTVPLDDTFTWQPTITTPGSYEVFACWTEDPSRATDATYTIYHDGGDSPTDVPKDQTKDGGTVDSVKWNSLGIYSFDGVNDYVELKENPNGVVIADAIKFVLQ